MTLGSVVYHSHHNTYVTRYYKYQSLNNSFTPHTGNHSYFRSYSIWEVGVTWIKHVASRVPIGH